jgi:flagellar motor switch protein FliN/FliY
LQVRAPESNRLQESRIVMPEPTKDNIDFASPASADRLRGLPVPIIVKLAEKKIEMGQLLAIGPGAIITFEKSCEDLLDLYVNNHLYCRGEAVKIGEKFGIKVCEVGSAQERASAVLAGQ